MKWDQMKESPPNGYLAVMPNQQARFEKIIQNYPEYKDYVQFGYFSGFHDNLRRMDGDQYKRIWDFAIKDEDYLDALLHLKWAFKLEGIEEGKMLDKNWKTTNLLADWSLNDFKLWAEKFIETKEKKLTNSSE
jgi:hypothetical protein